MATVADLPIYSHEGGAARDIFFADSVDVLFYFEDAGQEFVYTALLSKMGVRANFEVVCTGGKTKFRAAQLESSAARKIFICDKDFDDITGEAGTYLSYGFAYLGRFCFENYLLDVDALRSLVVESSRLQLRQVVLGLDFEQYISRLVTQYEKLGRVYAVARKHRIKIPTTKTDGDALLENGEDIPCDEYIDSVRDELIQWCEANNHWILDRETLKAQELTAFEVPEKYRDISDGTVTTHLCGKHLMRLVILKIDEIFSTNLRNEDVPLLYSRLMSYVSPDAFSTIKSRLFALLP